MHTRAVFVALVALSTSALLGVARAQSYSVLYQFCSQANCSDGRQPWAGLIRDTRGDLYGTTREGGHAGCADGLGCGTVFKLAPDGTETVLHAFAVVNDGDNPLGGLVMDEAGNMYGTTSHGGNSGCGSSGCGVVFQIAQDGTETILHTFGDSPDGAEPEGRLVLDKKGNLYGTTKGGGAHGVGTIFMIGGGVNETVLYSFKGGSDGELPAAGLLLDGAHNLFGTTPQGGDGYECTEGCGTVFKLAPDGTESVIYAFQGSDGLQTDGANPFCDLTEDAAGNLYGTTESGGSDRTGCYLYGGCGTVFRIASDGTETVLHVFPHDNRFPVGGVVSDRFGRLYGATSDSNGSVFKIGSDGGRLKVLHAFKGDDGYYVAADLLKGPGGELYGMTADGGANGGGTVFVIKK